MSPVSRALSAICWFVAAAGPAAAVDAPRFFDPGSRLPAPLLGQLQTLRFVTTGDFPPFNSMGPTGNPIGYNVDLAREICRELALLDRCVIRALPMTEAIEALKGGQADALIAGLSISVATRAEFAFSLPYLSLPARFVTRRASARHDDDAWSGKRVGVAAGTSHERLLRDYFPDARVVTYTNPSWMLDDLKAGTLDAAFGDGMRLSLWLARADGQDCCAFWGGPLIAPEYLGFGLSIAARPGEDSLVSAFDAALRELERKGVTGELYLRYFPVGFF